MLLDRRFAQIFRRFDQLVQLRLFLLQFAENVLQIGIKECGIKDSRVAKEEE